MNIILFDEKDFVAENQIELGGRPYEHAHEILTVQENDMLRVGQVNGKLGIGRVCSCQEGVLRLDVELTDDPPEKHDMTVVLALPRPPVLRRVLSAVTALGAAKIVIVHSARVEKSYWNSPALSDGQIRETLMLGLEQARDTILPEVCLEQRFRPFVEDRLPMLTKGRQCFLATAENALPCPADIDGPVVLAVGPEGGFVDFEIQQFCALGFQPVHLGPRILRVETAVQALIGRLLQIKA